MTPILSFQVSYITSPCATPTKGPSSPLNSPTIPSYQRKEKHVVHSSRKSLLNHSLNYRPRSVNEFKNPCLSFWTDRMNVEGRRFKERSLIWLVKSFGSALIKPHFTPPFENFTPLSTRLCLKLPSKHISVSIMHRFRTIFATPLARVHSPLRRTAWTSLVPSHVLLGAQSI